LQDAKLLIEELHQDRRQDVVFALEMPIRALLPERSSPELLYLETKWAALVAGERRRSTTPTHRIDVAHSALRIEAVPAGRCGT
jgi:hypothetical protein